MLVQPLRTDSRTCSPTAPRPSQARAVRPRSPTAPSPRASLVRFQMGAAPTRAGSAGEGRVPAVGPGDDPPGQPRRWLQRQSFDRRPSRRSALRLPVAGSVHPQGATGPRPTPRRTCPRIARAHWRGYGRILAEHAGEDALAEVFRTHFWTADPASGCVPDLRPATLELCAGAMRRGRPARMGVRPWRSALEYVRGLYPWPVTVAEAPPGPWSGGTGGDARRRGFFRRRAGDRGRRRLHRRS